ncbi:hypothetical protein PhCBS80983_g05010 [Powellomyces hirtus]|uniref:Homeobox domain-containing protein n=1 Tax=Powellomyces hirtus TaxID=109895 RepID=A0A507DWC9_9FUNG|nr:hypothetical protein PhCBS80983_g05010 [Powellomyces hirtus]
MTAAVSGSFGYDERPAKRRFSVDILHDATTATYFPVHSQTSANVPNASFRTPDTSVGRDERMTMHEEADSSDDASDDTKQFHNASGTPGAQSQNADANGSGSTTSKKRARATPEQLAILEETFLTQTSPNAKLREILASKVNMTERSIQIWFQNRRAKVKLMQKRAAQHAAQEQAHRAQSYLAATYGMHGGYYNPYGTGFPFSPYGQPAIQPRPAMGRSSSVDFSAIGMGMRMATGPGAVRTTTGPGNNAALDLAGAINGGQAMPQMQQQPQQQQQATTRPRQNSEPYGNLPVHKQGQWPSSLSSSLPPSTKLSAESLSIGSWRRVPIASNDLSCTIQSDAQTIRYEIAEGPSRFKIEYPFAALVSVSFDAVDAFHGQLLLDISMPPVFFMENSGGMTQPTWTQCRDFTENMQATCVLRHVIKGNAQALAAEWGRVCQSTPHLQRVTRLMAKGPERPSPMQGLHPLMTGPGLTTAPSGPQPPSPFRRHSTPALLVSQFTHQPSLPAYAEENYSEELLASPSSSIDTLSHAHSLQLQQQQQQQQQYHQEQHQSTEGLLDELSFISLEPNQPSHQQRQQQQQQHQHQLMQVQQDGGMSSYSHYGGLDVLPETFLDTLTSTHDGTDIGGHMGGIEGSILVT